MSGTVVLDNEAVQALWSPRHPRHRRALGLVEVVATRNRKKRRGDRIVVPTAVRVEAGWDRSDPRAAFVDLLGIGDVVLDGPTTNRAAVIATEHRVSVADAHLGAVVQQLPASDRPTVVITSDPADMARVAGGAPVTVVAL